MRNSVIRARCGVEVDVVIEDNIFLSYYRTKGNVSLVGPFRAINENRQVWNLGRV